MALMPSWQPRLEIFLLAVAESRLGTWRSAREELGSSAVGSFSTMLWSALMVLGFVRGAILLLTLH